MRFKLGIAVGFAAGYWVGTTSAEERRAKVDELLAEVRGNPRLQRVADTVTKDARRLGDAVEQRFVSTTDSAADTVASTVETDDKAANGTSSRSSSAKSA
jgi:hypothetical protein